MLNVNGVSTALAATKTSTVTMKPDGTSVIPSTSQAATSSAIVEVMMFTTVWVRKRIMAARPFAKWTCRSRVREPNPRRCAAEQWSPAPLLGEDRQSSEPTTETTKMMPITIAASGHNHLM